MTMPDLDLGALAFVALFAVYAGWWLHGWHTLHAERDDREFWRRLAQRELAARGPDSEHWT